MKLDKRSSQPLYAQLKEVLVERIQQDVYQSGQQIPSELALCEELSLSRPTVRQAIAELVAEGVLVIVKGKGTFVAAEPERIEMKNFGPFSFSLLSARTLEPMQQLQIDTMPGDPEIDRVFGVTGGSGHAGYWSITWRQEEEGQCYATCQSLIPVYMFPELGQDLQQGRRLIDIMANKYAYLPQKASARTYVRQARLEEARILDISRSAPVLVSSSRLTSRSSNVCEIVTAIMRSDLVSLGLDAGRS
jgi:DNA-binding GntR family transcriptional regulator